MKKNTKNVYIVEAYYEPNTNTNTNTNFHSVVCSYIYIYIISY